MSTACAPIDIKSAFDTAWSPTILTALGKRNCPGYLLCVLKSFLHNRRVSLSLQDASLEVDLKIGCPQGSLLSSFVWCILIDDILRLTFPFRTLTIAYADDLTVTATHKDPALATSNLQRMVDEIKSRLGDIKLKINAKKTTLIVFSRKRIDLGNVQLKITDHTIYPSSQAKLLGVVLDCRLKWLPHIQEKETAVKRVFHAVRRYVGKNWGLSRHRLKTLYTAVAEPTLLYCCSVWVLVLATKRGTQKIRSIERHFNLLITKAFKTADTGAISILAGTFPADYRAREVALRRRLLSNFPSFSPSSDKMIAGAIESVNILSSQMDPNSQKPSIIKRAIRANLAHSWSSEWRSSNSGLLTKRFFPTPQCFKQLRMSNLPQQAIQILTGHCFLNSHQFRFNFSNSQCCACKYPIETVDHFLFECKIFSDNRSHFMHTSLSLVNCWPPNIPDIHKHPNLFTEMIKFVISTKRLNYAK